MLKLRLKLILTVFLLIIIVMASAPRAEAFEPISTSVVAAILLPIALEVAKAAAPYVAKGIVNFGGGMADVFVDMAGIFLLPLGFVESTFLAPFGFFGPGMRHMVKGAIAPFKMTWSTVVLPVRIFSG